MSLQTKVESLPDDVLRLLHSFLPCQSILRYCQTDKLVQLFDKKEDDWVMAHLPVFESIHNRETHILIDYYRNEIYEGDSPKQCAQSERKMVFYQNQICKFKKGRKYLNRVQANGKRFRQILLTDAPTKLRTDARTYYEKERNYLQPFLLTFSILV